MRAGGGRTAARLLAVAALAAGLAPGAGARKFYDDDPLLKEPRPRDAGAVKSRKLSDYYDFFENLFRPAGERSTPERPIPAQAVNTLGEPMESAWYTPRHYFRRMSLEELTRGAGDDRPPRGRWTIIGAKSEGITPGFMVKDESGEVFVVKFDPPRYPELATGADIISSKILHAAGYNVPEYYIVLFHADDLVLGDDVELRDALGQKRKMTRRDVIELLAAVPRDATGRRRAIASRFLTGKPVGPFRYHGTRADDPNDTVPHEHRRDLRGLGVFAAWIAHDDSRSINTFDALVEEDGVRFVKHYLMDFGSTLGSASHSPNTPRSGSEYLFAWRPALLQFVTLGLYVPEWARKSRYPDLAAVGRFEAEVFNPLEWKAEYPHPAFTNRLPDDDFWGAKQVMAFTGEEIRAVVGTARYSDPRAADYIADTLIKRRDKIGKAFFARVLPLDRFAVQDGRLVFEDLEIRHGFRQDRELNALWASFDNETGRSTPLPGETSFAVPAVSGVEFLECAISGREPKKTVTVYLGKTGQRWRVVGIERGW
jgi:hypothetical protein